MVSGIDDPPHRLWTQPGQTLRGRVNHRTKEPLLKYSVNLLRTNSRIVPGSQYHGDNYEAVELSVLRHKEGAAHLRLIEKRANEESDDAANLREILGHGCWRCRRTGPRD